MYGRSGQLDTSQTDISFFVGASLTQICFGVSDLGLNFDFPSINIMTQSDFAISIAGQPMLRHEVTSGHLLRRFLNRDVSAAAWAELGTLVLTFGEDQIFIFDDSEQFESYTIRHGSNVVIV